MAQHLADTCLTVRQKTRKKLLTPDVTRKALERIDWAFGGISKKLFNLCRHVLLYNIAIEMKDSLKCLST
jgi:hypothetical protein